MCSICGILISPDSPIREDEDLCKLVKALFVKTFTGLEGRGKDASGFVILNSDTSWQLIKAPIRSSHFPYLDEFYQQLSIFGPTTNIILAHARAKTKGTEYNNYNNHPTEYEGLVGVHNGGISNDDTLFKAMSDRTRYGEVDSEAVWASLYDACKDIKKMTIKEIGNAMDTLTGTLACAGAAIDNPTRMMVARDTNPIDVIAFKKLGMLIFVSNKDFVTSAIDSAFIAGRIYNINIPKGIFERKVDTFPASTAMLFRQDEMTMANIENLAKYSETIKISVGFTARNNNTGGYHNSNMKACDGDNCHSYLNVASMHDIDGKKYCYQCSQKIKAKKEEEEKAKKKVEEAKKDTPQPKTELIVSPPVDHAKSIKTVETIITNVGKTVDEHEMAGLQALVCSSAADMMEKQFKHGVGRNWQNPTRSRQGLTPSTPDEVKSFDFIASEGTGKNTPGYAKEATAYEIGYAQGWWRGTWTIIVKAFLYGYGIGKLESTEKERSKAKK